MEGESLREGRYAVTKILGEGAQGSTFEAVDKREGRLVAVKRFDVRGAKAWKDVELAEREARVLSSLTHPSLPAYIEHFEEGGRLYLVMQKIEGKSLGSMLKERRRFGEEDVVRLLHDAADALAYLHGRGVIHRDLKPGNVIRRGDGSFAFVDFGAVRDRIRSEGGSTVVGTFGYMAPEQFQGRALPATDVYAIGATAIAMLTGKQPEELPHRGLGIDVPGALRGVAGPALTRAIANMLEPDPEKRASQIEVPEETARTRRSEPDEPRRADDRSRERRVPIEGDLRTRKQARREARRARRAARAGRPRSRLPFLPLLLVLVALAVARVAVSLALFVVVPAVLTVLSLVFGSALRDAARAVTRGGRRAYGALDDQAQRLDGRARENGPGSEPHVRVEPRVRVHDSAVGAAPADPDGEADEDSDGASRDPGQRRAR